MGTICDCNETKYGLFICPICNEKSGYDKWERKGDKWIFHRDNAWYASNNGNLMILLKIVGKILEELLLINGMQLDGFVVFAVILLKLFMIIFLIIQGQKNIK